MAGTPAGLSRLAAAGFVLAREGAFALVYPPAEAIPALAVNLGTRAASLDLAPIEGADAGAADDAGPLLSDIDFAAFSHSALARIDN